MRSIADFKEEVRRHYTGQSSEVTIDRDSTTPNTAGNAIMNRSLYTLIVCLNGEQDQRDLNDFRECMRLREADGPGVYHRNPGDASRNAHDDHFYAASASKVIESDRSVARAILNYYRVHDGYVNDQNPKPTGLMAILKNPIAAWFGRFYWFKPHLMNCSGEPLGLVEDKRLALGNDLIPPKDDAGALIMAWVRARLSATAGGCSLTSGESAFRKIAAMRPGGLADLCAEYYNRQGDTPHPFSWREVWQRIQ